MYSNPAGPEKGQHHYSTSHHLDVGTVRYADSCASPPDVDRQVTRGHNRHSSWSCHTGWGIDERLAFFPEHQCEAVRSFASWSSEALGLFDNRQTCGTKRTGNYIVQYVMPGHSTWSPFCTGNCAAHSTQLMVHTGTGAAPDTSRSPSPTLTASSSNLKPQDVISIANSQCPLCSAEAAREQACWDGKLRLDWTMTWSARIPGLSQNGCLGGVFLE